MTVCCVCGKSFAEFFQSVNTWKLKSCCHHPHTNFSHYEIKSSLSGHSIFNYPMKAYNIHQREMVENWKILMKTDDESPHRFPVILRVMAECRISNFMKIWYGDFVISMRCVGCPLSAGRCGKTNWKIEILRLCIWKFTKFITYPIYHTNEITNFNREVYTSWQ